MDLECIDARTITPDDARAIAEMLVKIWPKPEKPLEVRIAEALGKGTGFAGPEELRPRFYVLRPEGRVLAMSALFPRTIQTSRGLLTIAGLGWVSSDPELRGQGLGAEVVRAVFAQVDNGTFAFSLFQTTPPVRPFYEKLGARVVENRIYNSLSEDSHSEPFHDPVVMRYPSGGDWPEGDIDLQGPGY